MTRRRIELHNYDKYQPYFHAPLIDRIEGDSQEIIISADGNETSTSGGTTGSITINASGGMWFDLGGVITSQQAHVTDGITSGSQTTVFTMPTSDFTHTTLTIITSAADRTFHEQTEVIHDGTNVAIRRGDPTNAGSGGSSSSNPFSLAASISYNSVTLDYSNFHTSTVNVRILSRAVKI